ncbi:MAG TPA: hypothetical protein VFQ71_13210 [Gaiellales bacterium]|nr:hypothetical protein [Gaiellales bacterium]
MEIIGTIAVVVSVLVLAYQGRELAGQTRVANEVAATRAHRELLFHWKSVLDVFVRHPELHALYYAETAGSPDADDAVRLDVIAEQHADWLNTALMTETQLESFPVIYANWVGGWHAFTVNAIAASPALRALIRSRPKEWPMLDPILADHRPAERAEG